MGNQEEEEEGEESLVVDSNHRASLQVEIGLLKIIKQTDQKEKTQLFDEYLMGA